MSMAFNTSRTPTSIDFIMIIEFINYQIDMSHL